ncbi:hypothetical protein PQQ96_32745 [Paraburkholderia sediminicola]
MGAWIRPVSGRQDEGVTLWEQRYDSANGALPQVLDVINVPLLGHRPNGCQSENWVLDPDRWWTKDHEVNWATIATYAENPDVLFVNAGRTFAGLNDEIPNAVAVGLPNSLVLIAVPTLCIRVYAGYNDARKMQARFQYNGVDYALGITDPVIEAEFFPQGLGEYETGRSLLCISLSMPFTKTNGNGGEYRYKLVAAVIRQP